MLAEYWVRVRVFFDIQVCHSDADSYRDLSLKQIFQNHENEKKWQYGNRVMEV